MRELFPEIPLVVVSEFPPEGGVTWIPFHVRRTFRDNLALCRASLRGKRVRLSAVILQPRMPYWRMRAVGFALSPWNFVGINENFGHFMLRPRSVPTILGHFKWRLRNLIVWETRPGGFTYTMVWRFFHPWAFGRPILAILAELSGWVLSVRKRIFPGGAGKAVEARLPDGISVVIPSRNGRELLARGLPGVVSQGVDVIVSDNGSDDGTAEWLAERYPQVRVVHSAEALSFARAVNAGIALAGYSHVCLLNNDMVIEPGFFAALRAPFGTVPDLFCSTAQIFFPEGVRREETGKAVMTPGASRKAEDFPVSCVEPILREDHSYVLYGSGGCSLYDTAKLRALGALDPIFEPAYVEDLDLGVRGWQRGWPTVFAAGAKVLHLHRATTSRYYTEDQLARILEVNYLRFLARTVAPPAFGGLWKEAVGRLNLLASRQTPYQPALDALAVAWRAPFWGSNERAIRKNELLFAFCSGAVAVFPGRVRFSEKPIVLIATPYLPFPLAHGGAVRMYNLMRQGAAEFDLVLVSFVDEPRPVPQELLDLCVEAVLVKRFGSHLRGPSDRPDVVEEFDSPAFHAALRQTAAKWKPAVAQLEFTQMAQYAADCAPAKTLLVEHDITLDLYAQLLIQSEDWETRRQYERWVRFERAAWKQVDRVITMSAKDAAMVGERAAALPNGVDIERFTPSDEAPEPGRLLFIGSFGHLPNLLAMEFFLREVWPLLEGSGAVLHVIAGARSRYFVEHYRDRVQVDLDRPGLEVEDFVADVRPAYRRASVAIAPLLASAGTNIKILEALAMGKAVVSTPGGVNGLDEIRQGVEVLVAGSAAEMAAAIRMVLGDAEVRRGLEREARAAAVGRFSWAGVGRRQAEVYREAL